MFDLSASNTYWLNLTNTALGIATLVLAVVIAREILHDLHGRLHGKSRIRPNSEKLNS